MTKCTFHKFGPSGTVQAFDGLCVLPLNIINEKIYVFLWFWFVTLAFITAFQVEKGIFFNIVKVLASGDIPSFNLPPAEPEDHAAQGQGKAQQEPEAGGRHL